MLQAGSSARDPQTAEIFQVKVPVNVPGGLSPRYCCVLTCPVVAPMSATSDSVDLADADPAPPATPSPAHHFRSVVFVLASHMYAPVQNLTNMYGKYNLSTTESSDKVNVIAHGRLLIRAIGTKLAKERSAGARGAGDPLTREGSDCSSCSCGQSSRADSGKESFWRTGEASGTNDSNNDLDASVEGVRALLLDARMSAALTRIQENVRDLSSRHAAEAVAGQER